MSLVPPQHGAWAFLGLPLIVGIAFAPWTPVLLVLAVAWIAAYPWSYFVLAMVRQRRLRAPHPERYARGLQVWSLIAVPALVALVVLRPWLIWVGVLYAIGFAVNAAFAVRRDDRALVNDAVFIVECALVVPVAWAIGTSERTLAPLMPSAVPVQVWIMTAAVALLLTGSTLHVKSLIRERSNPRFAAVSQGFAIVSLVLSFVLATRWGLPSGLWLVPPFGFAVGRSYAMRHSSPRPARIGMVELAVFVLLAVAALVLGWGS